MLPPPQALSPLPSARSSRPSQQPLAHSTEVAAGGGGGCPTPSFGAAPPRSRRNTTLQISILLRRRRAPTLPRFPGAILPPQIFEFRCRIMIHALLQTDLRFGVIYTDATSGTANVGCVGEIVRHERFLDDRFFLICKGQVPSIARTKPYLVAQVTWLEDRPSGDGGGDDLETLAREVETYMKDVIRLSNRLSGKPEKKVQHLRRNLFPTPFSFLAGSTFEGAPREQQALLELEDTATRLKREKETMRDTLNYLSAATAMKDVFPSS